MKKILFIVCLLIIGVSQGQDAMFSQYYSSELYLNPALAGEEQDLTFSSNYRSQWRSIVLPYVTTQFSLVYPLYSKDIEARHVGGVGLSLYTDKAGDGNFKTLGLSATFAYNLKLTHDDLHNVSFAGQVGMVQKSVDLDKLQWGSQFNPYIGFDASEVPDESHLTSGTLYPDISAGVMYYYNVYKTLKKRSISGFFGGSAYHMNKPNESFADDRDSYLPVLYKVHGGLDIPISKKGSISPNVLTMIQKDVYLVDFGFYYTHEILSYPGKFLEETAVTVGAWMRPRDAFIFSAGIGNRAYQLGFSYDYNNSSLRFATRGRGAWEISLVVRWLKKHNIKRVYTPRI